ncbi:MAG TPA: DMT family transporter [Gaiellaceae bacterium]|nr:DMT family transporter [Gaiellaceae bacterium]
MVGRLGPVSRISGAPRLTTRMETAVPAGQRVATGHAALMAVSVAWAGAFSAIKALLDHGIAAEDVALLRYFVAAPGFAAVLWLSGGLPGLTRKDAVRVALIGVLVVGGYHVSLNVGTRSTTSGTAALVVALSPALTLAFATFAGLSRATARRLAGLAVAFAGVAVVVLLGAGGELSFTNAKGPLIVLGAALSFALYNVLLQPLLDRYGLLALTAASSLVGTLAILPLAGGSTLDSAAHLSAVDAALVLYLGVVCTLVGYVAWNVGLRALGSASAVTYAYVIPVLAVAFGAVLLDETVTLWLGVGGALVLGGVALAQRQGR